MNMRGPLVFTPPGESGAAFIEAAVALPVLLIIVSGAFDFGRAFSTLADAQRGLRTATRFLTALPAESVCGWGLVQARNLAVYGNTAGHEPKVIAGWKTSDITMQAPVNCNVADIGLIRLSAKVSYEALMWKTVGLPESITFTIEHEERWQGE